MDLQSPEIRAVEQTGQAHAPARRTWPDIEKHFALGLRDNWYAILPSDEVPVDKPIGITRLGEDLAVWRDADGKVRVFEDRCPHRGAKLSLGIQREGNLHCWYHGWKFDPTGQCTHIPSAGSNSPIAARMKVRSYPVEEHGGIVFAYFAKDGASAPKVPCPNPYELESKEWSGFILRHHWKGVPWIRALDNLLDPLHGPHLHAGTYTLGKTKLEADVVEARVNEDGSHYVGRKGQALVNFDFTEYHFPNWTRLDIPYPWSAGPGGPMRIVVLLCPINENDSQVYMVRKRKITGWRWWIWKVLWHVRLKRKMWQVIHQDEAILGSQRGRYCLEKENLVQSDAGVAHMRRLFHEALKKEEAAQ
jgi:phenylpropionate dioxygenase-like ring-hydroxylating dioxygenase large terminal subunit